jgi:hypothetical protein
MKHIKDLERFFMEKRFKISPNVFFNLVKKIDKKAQCRYPRKGRVLEYWQNLFLRAIYQGCQYIWTWLCDNTKCQNPITKHHIQLRGQVSKQNSISTFIHFARNSNYSNSFPKYTSLLCKPFETLRETKIFKHLTLIPLTKFKQITIDGLKWYP